MFIGSRLTGRPCFFGDPVSLDERENTITYWHCGMAACNLARRDTSARVGGCTPTARSARSWISAANPPRRSRCSG